MNQKTHVKKSKRNTSRSSAPVRQIPGGQISGGRPSVGRSSVEQRSGIPPVTQRTGTPVFSYPDEPQAFPIHDSKSGSFPTDKTSYAQKKDINLFTPPQHDFYRESPKKSSTYSERSSLSRSRSEQTPRFGTPSPVVFDFNSSGNPRDSRHVAPDSKKKEPRISSTYTRLSDSAFQPTDENEAYARAITDRRREERKQAELERIRREKQRAQAEEEIARREGERKRYDDENARREGEHKRYDEENARREPVRKRYDEENARSEPVRKRYDEENARREPEHSRTTAYKMNEEHRSHQKNEHVRRKNIRKVISPSVKTQETVTQQSSPVSVPSYLREPAQPQAFHEVPAPLPRKKKRKKQPPEPQLSDHQPLLDYTDEKRQPDTPPENTVRIPAQVRIQTETVTDLQDVIPVKEGTGDTRPHAIKKERESRRKRDERLTYLLVAFVIIFAVSAFFLFRIFWGYKKSSNEYTSLEKDYVEVPEDANQPVNTDDSAYAKTPYPNLKINFPSLYAINNDLLGWIYVPGCAISYPFVKGTDNDYYLSHSFKKEASSNGAIFMDYQDKSDFTSFNTFIYGHDMRDGSMFAPLFKYGTDADLIGSYPYFFIYLTNGNVLKYHICSFYTGDGNSDSFLRVDSPEQKASYVAMILAKSTLIKSEAAADSHLATADDTFVTLSTCHGEGQRFLIHGYLTAIYNTLTNTTNELY